jgi:hypothetical protein
MIVALVAGTTLVAVAAAAGGEGPGTIVIRPSEGPSPERQAAVRGWIERVRPEIDAVLAGWAGARRDLGRWPRRGTAPGCRALARAVPAVDMERFEPIPDARLAAALAEAVWRLGEGAQSCVADRYFDAAFHFEEALKAYLQLARGLKRYGVEP